MFNSVNLEDDTSTDLLMRAFCSANYICCITFNNKLVALARSMDDNCWNANIDCVVMHKDHQHKGIGTMLMKILLEQLEKVSCISLSPNFREVKGFYERLGFREVESGCLLQIVKDV